MSAYRLLDDEAKEETLSWLSARAERDLSTGFDATGWARSTWVLHSIYEDPSADYEATHDDLHRQRVAAGLERPTIVNGVDLDATSTVIGNSLGMSGPIGVDCVRIRWTELADRLSIDLAASDVPPCPRWFPYRSWPAGLHPPDEGSLDFESLNSLVPQLSTHSVSGAATHCIAFYAPLAGGGWSDPWLAEFDLGNVESLVDATPGGVGTPSNWWPVDQSWMVYTDWDLWATKVSGSDALIDAIINDEALETIEWPCIDR